MSAVTDISSISEIVFSEYTNNFDHLENITESGQSNFSAWFSSLFGTLSVAIALTAILGNFLVIATILTNRQLITYTNSFIVGLAMADLCNGVEITFRSVNTYLGYWPFGKVGCEIFLFVAHYTVQVIYVLILVIAIDRFRSIRSPLHHLRMKRLTYAVRQILATYISQVLVISFYLYALPLMLGRGFDIPDKVCLSRFSINESIGLYFMLITRYVPVLTTGMLYVVIYAIITRRKLFKKSLTTETKSNNPVTEYSLESKSVATVSVRFDRSTVDLETATHQHPSAGGKKRSYYRAERTLTMIFFILLVSSLPYIIAYSVHLLCDHCVSIGVFNAAVVVSHMSFAINPICYATGNPLIRAGIINLVCRPKRGEKS
ncbi:beta-4C adrenergic receptor-like [Diadema setosum]|uniref:beta-4C adrenergic receptor-like n=1 Tax=Diadema setosum TaxID=31175 RepID=UPI003B3AEF3E